MVIARSRGDDTHCAVSRTRTDKLRTERKKADLKRCSSNRGTTSRQRQGKGSRIAGPR
jgi:hypothetical protein